MKSGKMLAYRTNHVSQRLDIFVTIGYWFSRSEKQKVWMISDTIARKESKDCLMCIVSVGSVRDTSADTDVRRSLVPTKIMLSCGRVNVWVGGDGGGVRSRRELDKTDRCIQL